MNLNNRTPARVGCTLHLALNYATVAKRPSCNLVENNPETVPDVSSVKVLRQQLVPFARGRNPRGHRCQ